jgi:hypothetical protein
MPDEPAKPVTVEELLPAMIELASIQHDFLVAMAPSASKEDPRLRGTPLSYGGKMLYDAPPLRVSTHDIGKLLARTRELLVWLLDRAKTGS